jgi:DNA-binding MarR family transcriptional regulator
VDRAERRGLVERARHASDGRSTRVRLTAEGHAQVNLAAAEVARRIAPVVEQSHLSID